MLRMLLRMEEGAGGVDLLDCLRELRRSRPASVRLASHVLLVALGLANILLLARPDDAELVAFTTAATGLLYPHKWRRSSAVLVTLHRSPCSKPSAARKTPASKKLKSRTKIRSSRKRRRSRSSRW